MHGYAVSQAIRRASQDALHVEEGALYPALRRLEKKGLLESRWGTSDTGRQAKFYRLTERGHQRLRREMDRWGEYVDAMAGVLYGAGDSE